MPFLVRIIAVFLLLLVVQYLFIRVIVKALKRSFPGMNRKIYRFIRNLFLILFNLYPVILLVYGISQGNTPFPENNFIDYVLIFPFWLYILICAQTLLLVLAEKILKVLVYPLYKKRKLLLYNFEQKIVIIIFVFSVVYVPLRVQYDYYNVEIRHVVYKKENIKPVLKNFKLVFISDTQADRYTNFKRLGNYISLVNQQNPDLVVIGGDVITSGPQYIDTAAAFLGQIKSRYGVYTCLGDHDHWAYRQDIQRSIHEVTASLAKKNVPMINNRNIDINVNGADVLLTFITNTYVERTPNDVVRKLIRSDKKDLKILITHQPGRDMINLSSARNYDLFLAGHTHGGQITFLFPFINLTPTLFETTYVKGDFKIGNMLMIVTRGLGMSLVPMRLNSTPEITVITFASGN